MGTVWSKDHAYDVIEQSLICGNKSYIYSSFADLGIDVPDFLDLSRLRATGLQAGEEELPDLMPPIVLPEDTRGTEMNL